MPSDVTLEGSGSRDGMAPRGVGGSVPRTKPPPDRATGTAPPASAPGQKGGHDSEAARAGPEGALASVSVT